MLLRVEPRERAWSKRRFHAVLGAGPVTDARAAVRVAIVGEVRRAQNQARIALGLALGLFGDEPHLASVSQYITLSVTDQLSGASQRSTSSHRFICDGPVVAPHVDMHLSRTTLNQTVDDRLAAQLMTRA